MRHKAGEKLLCPFEPVEFRVDGLLQAQGCLNAGEELTAIDRFSEEVISTGLNRTHAIIHLSEGRHDYHGNQTAVGIVLHPLACFDAIHDGHHYIEQDQVWRLALDLLEGQGAVFRR